MQIHLVFLIISETWSTFKGKMLVIIRYPQAQRAFIKRNSKNEIAEYLYLWSMDIVLENISLRGSSLPLAVSHFGTGGTNTWSFYVLTSLMREWHNIPNRKKKSLTVQVLPSIKIQIYRTSGFADIVEIVWPVSIIYEVNALPFI